MANNDKIIVHAEPSKAFFIDMITRDLTVADSLLDLIDNSVDRAIATKPTDIMEMLRAGSFRSALRSLQVQINFSAGTLTVEDNCGGISVEEARDKVFLFGNPEERGAPGGLSVYGIGMKRAFFKLGHHFRVESANKKNWFVVNVDVDKWKQQKDWNFMFDNVGNVGDRKATVPPENTRLTVTNLRDEVRTRLDQTSFQKDLLNRLGSTYALFLKAGFSIRVNGKEVAERLPIIGSTKEVVPANKLLKEDKIQTLIIAGIRPTPADAVSAGWYVFCNGRMVLEADKSATTGWGELLPQWHTKYSRFAGYVYFGSQDVQLLPWTTTKRGVVFELPVYQTALREMQVQARSILAFLNKLYPSDLSEEDVPEREALKELKGVTIDQIAPKQTAFKVKVLRARSDQALVSIQYRRRRRDLDRIRQHLGKLTLSNSGIGELTFDHYMKMEVEP